MTCSCTGVGVVYPSSRTARTSSAERPRAVNGELASTAGSGGGPTGLSTGSAVAAGAFCRWGGRVAALGATAGRRRRREAGLFTKKSPSRGGPERSGFWGRPCAAAAARGGARRTSAASSHLGPPTRHPPADAPRHVAHDASCGNSRGVSIRGALLWRADEARRQREGPDPSSPASRLQRGRNLADDRRSAISVRSHRARSVACRERSNSSKTGAAGLPCGEVSAIRYHAALRANSSLYHDAHRFHFGRTRRRRPGLSVWVADGSARRSAIGN